MITQFRVLTTWLQARFNTDERGAALVEYALLVALIAVVSILVLTSLGEGIRDKFTEVDNKIGGAGTTTP